MTISKEEFNHPIVIAEMARLQEVHSQLDAYRKKRKGKRRVSDKEAELTEDFILSLVRLSVYGSKIGRQSASDD